MEPLQTWWDWSGFAGVFGNSGNWSRDLVAVAAVQTKTADIATIQFIGPVSLADLGRQMLVDKGQLSRVVSRLVERGWVNNHKTPGNRNPRARKCRLCYQFRRWSRSPAPCPADANLKKRAHRAVRVREELNGPPQDLAQKIIKRRENLASLGVMTSLLLVHLLLMAPAAVLRGNDHWNDCAIVVERVDIARLGAMAVEAVDSLLPVSADAPFLR
jgi:hypothetical protein